MTKMPEVLVNVEISREAKLAFEDEKHPVHAEIDKLNKEFIEKSWRLLVRPSGTENLLRVSIWGDDQAKIDEAAKQIADDLKTKLEA
jgi:phosphomannomutase